MKKKKNESKNFMKFDRTPAIRCNEGITGVLCTHEKKDGVIGGEAAVADAFSDWSSEQMRVVRLLQYAQTILTNCRLMARVEV